MAVADHKLYVATARDDDDGGVVVLEVEPNSGALQRVGEHSTDTGLRALALHPSGTVLYGVGGGDHGVIVALRVAENSLDVMSVRGSGGSVPCSLAVDPSGRYLLVANYSSGEIVVHRLGANGNLGTVCTVVRHEGCGPVAERQDATHVHQVRFDTQSDTVLVTDLGSDSIYAYRLDKSNGELRPAPVHRSSAPPGSGPRHLDFHPSGYVVVADELSGNVSWYEFSRRTGKLSWRGSVPATRADASETNYPSEIAVGDGGRRVFVANRGPDTIAAFSADSRGLEPLAEATAGANWPQHFALAGTRLYCAGKHSGEITMFSISDAGTVSWRARHVASVADPTWILPAGEK